MSCTTISQPTALIHSMFRGLLQHNIKSIPIQSVWALNSQELLSPLGFIHTSSGRAVKPCGWTTFFLLPRNCSFFSCKGSGQGCTHEAPAMLCRYGRNYTSFLFQVNRASLQVLCNCASAGFKGLKAGAFQILSEEHSKRRLFFKDQGTCEQAP